MPDTRDRLSSALSDRYRLLRELGQGGMATVYLAEDLRNGRKVAIKVMQPEVASVVGSARFLEEIGTTANLQHPHILPLFDSGIVDDGASAPYYVMPYVEGETLRARLERERQLPVADAVRIAGEVAAALDYAHRQGIIHRDVKPENILLQDGRAIVADFGIARAMRTAGGERLTSSGLTLGTPAYMSPEQAAGDREIDARSDVYALGALTYEMLTGEPPFTGVSTQVMIARLMTEVPRPPSAIRRSIPATAEHAVMRALEKLPADRWSSAAAFADALARDEVAPVVRPSSPRTTLARVAAALVLLAAGAGLAVLVMRAGDGADPDATPRQAARLVIPLGADALPIGSNDGAPFEISADGAFIVYAAESRGTWRLHLRPIASFESKPVRGTEEGVQPFFSPDGRWIGFFAGGALKKVPRDGGDAITLASIDGAPSGGSWGEDGTIVYADARAELHRVAADGGPPVRLAVASARDDSLVAGGDSVALTQLRWPQVLPGGKHVLVSTNAGVAVVELATGALRHVIRAPPGRARWLASGHIVFDERDGRMRVIAFDAGRLVVTGGPSAAFEAFRSPGGGPAQYAVSRTGTLVYVAGGYERSLVLVDRNGRETPVDLPSRGYRFPSLSPDGRFLAVTIDPRPSSVWVVDLARGTSSRMTDSGHAIKPAWSHDGRRLAFVNARTIQWIPWPAGDAPRPVARDDRPLLDLYPSHWANDGRIILNRFTSSARDLYVLATGDSAARPLLETPAAEMNGAVSPDGRWLAWNSNATGSAEVYVRPYPGGGATTVVSTRGGVEPRWSRDGRELYYREGTRIMAVSVRAGSTFTAEGAPRVLFDGDYDFSQDANWDVGPGPTFIMVRGDPATHGRLLVVLDWFSELAAARGAP